MDKPGQTSGPSRPLSVKVGPFIYKITYREDMDPYREFGGMSHNDELEIWIKIYDEDKMREILTHEIVHCILHIYGGSPPDGVDLPQERTVTALGFGWLQVIRDNPQIVEYLTREVD